MAGCACFAAAPRAGWEEATADDSGRQRLQRDALLQRDHRQTVRATHERLVKEPDSIMGTWPGGSIVPLAVGAHSAAAYRDVANLASVVHET